jgi:YHS domain-containing protein
MDKVKDPVCEMMVDPSDAINIVYNAKAYHFCSSECSRAFQADPAKYSEAADPAYTVSKHMAAPRFGSAGSGGLENEPSPEVRGKR